MCVYVCLAGIVCGGKCGEVRVWTGQMGENVYKAVDYCVMSCLKAQTRFKCLTNVTLSVFYTVLAKIKKQLHIKYLPRPSV